MTVRRATGDGRGDLPIGSPAANLTDSEDVCSLDRPFGGHFWALQVSDGEGDGDADVVSPTGASDPSRYVWQTPVSASVRDISERSSELARRAIKRRNRQLAQREAAINVIQFDDEGMRSPFSRPLGQSLPRIKNKPVLEPSIFEDDGSEGWTVVNRWSWSPEITTKVPETKFTDILNSKLLGPVRGRAERVLVRARWGPNQTPL
jgi:hypothetical protein